MATTHHIPCGRTRPLAVSGWSGFALNAALDGSPDPNESFDFQRLDLDGDTGRIAIIDAAVAPWHDRHLVRTSAPLVLAELMDARDLHEGMRSADHLLYRPTARRHDNILFTAASCALDLQTGSLRAVVSGDCEVWARSRGIWRELLSEDSLASDARAAWGEIHPDLSHGDQWKLQRELLNSPESWTRSTLGLGIGRFGDASIANVEAMIVSSDGARLTADRCAHLGVWLTDGIHSEPRPAHHAHPHGDISMVFLEQLSSL